MHSDFIIFIRLNITQFHHINQHQIILTSQNMTVYYKNNDTSAIPQYQMQNSAGCFNVNSLMRHANARVWALKAIPHKLA